MKKYKLFDYGRISLIPKRKQLIGFFVVVLLIVALVATLMIMLNQRAKANAGLAEENKELKGKIEALTKDIEGLKNEVGNLKYAHETTTKEATRLKTVNNSMKGFLKDMQPDIRKIAELSECIDCCSVAAIIVQMGHFFSNYTNRINEFLNTPMTLPGITIISPNGNELYANGTRMNITWVSQIGGNVAIEYSANNGESWTTIIDSTPNDGSYSWTVPNETTDECLIRIGMTSTGTPFDVSDNVFSVIKCTPNRRD